MTEDFALNNAGRHYPAHRALARAITIVENNMPGAAELLRALRGTEASKVVGITGPPGAGKSTLVDAMLGVWVAAGKKVGILAVDPSSPFHFGALLGDRIRLSRYYTHPRVFIRSLASRGALGGLHPRTMEVADVMKGAGFDLVIIETVGVGQSEVDIAGLADCTVVTLVPEAGDMVQTMKAGLMEVADIFAINKADREGAEAMYRHLKTMCHEQASEAGETPVLLVSATQNEGVDALCRQIEQTLKTPAGTGRRLWMLAGRAWSLIQNERMEGWSRRSVAAALAIAVKEPDFNLYTFAAQLAAGTH